MINALIGTIDFIIIIHILRQLLVKSGYSKIRTMMMGAFSLLGIWIITMNYYIYTKFTDKITAYYFLFMSSIAMISCLFVFSNIVSLIYSNKFGLKRSMYFSIIGTAVVITNLYLISNVENLNFNDEMNLIELNHVFTIIGIIVMLFSVLRDFGRYSARPFDLGFVNEEFNSYKKSTYILILAVPTYVLSILLEYDPLTIYQLILAIILFIFVRLLNNASVIRFFQPQSQFLVMIVNNSGGLIYQKNFTNPDESIYNAIFSNWLFAFTSILSEFLKNEKKPELIQLEDGWYIYLSWSKRFFVATVVDTTSPLILASMENTVKFINNEIDTSIFEYGGNAHHDVIEDIISRMFFYVDKL